MIQLILYVHFNEILLRVNDLRNLKVTSLELLVQLCVWFEVWYTKCSVIGVWRSINWQ